MVKSAFLGLGIFLVLLGLQMMVSDQIELRFTEQAPQSTASSMFAMAGGSEPKPIKFQPPEWAPWTFAGVGAVTILYSILLPGRLKEVVG
jgi:hypothetical protein